ncbi:hypothetical protein PG989_011469 [Apiospora arundinis]
MAADSTDKMSTESVSSIYPDRPIRPLPKRRMRDRLSSEELDTINYPPSPQNNVPLFDYPYNLKTETGGGPKEKRRMLLGVRTQPNWHKSQVCEGRAWEEEEEVAAVTIMVTHFTRRPVKVMVDIRSRNRHLQQPPRPTGDEGPGDPTLATPHAYYQSGPGNANTQGISGPGRGRYGRNRNGRSPLRTIPDVNVGLLKNPKLRSGGQYPGSPTGENSGIISNAIASAEKLSVPHGQENISLLQQQASSKTTPTSSQFTFTFDSPVPGSVSWPGSDSLHSQMAVPSRSSLPGDHRDPYQGATGRGTQTGPPLSGTSASGNLATNGSKPAAGATSKKSRRRAGSSLLQAARERRQQTEYQNYHHPPTLQDVWVCEFCEYERIFGRPPEALIRQYEIKDRRRRREEAERRRLLEKAKMKSRKGKKASNKLPAKNSNNTQERAAAPAGYQAPHMGNQPSQETQSEEFDEDDYYEEDAHDDAYIPPSDPQDNPSHDATSSYDGSRPGRGNTRDSRVPVA